MFSGKNHAAGVVAVIGLCVAGTAFIADGQAGTGTEVGFISALRGKPQIQDPRGKTAPAALMKQLSPGDIIILRANESFGFCHEGASKVFRVEGAGSVYIGDSGINSELGGPRVVATGVCNSSSAPNETGGVLLRTIQPPSSPK